VSLIYEFFSRLSLQSWSLGYRDLFIIVAITLSVNKEMAAHPDRPTLRHHEMKRLSYLFSNCLHYEEQTLFPWRRDTVYKVLNFELGQNFDPRGKNASCMEIRHGRKQPRKVVRCIKDVLCLWNDNELFLNIYFSFKNSRYYGRKVCPLGAYKHSFNVDDDKTSSLCNVSRIELEMKFLTYILRMWQCDA
jgi:hypothetical protein